MPVRLTVLILALLLVGMAPLAAGPLSSRFQQMTSEGPAQHAIWGIYAMEAESGRVLADVNGTRLLVPASNRKLVSTALATSRFDADLRLVTELRAEAMTGGTARGVVLHAVGDPSWMPSLLGGRPGTSRLRDLAAAAAKSGMRRIEGDLTIDTGRYEAPHIIPPAWNWDEFQSSYASFPAVLSVNANLGAVSIRPGNPGGPLVVDATAPVSPFQIINDSTTLGGGSAPTLYLERTLDGRSLRLSGGIPRDSSPAIRSIPLGQPVEYWGAVLLEELRSAGVEVTGDLRLERRREQGAVLLGSVEGARIADVVSRCNQESDNFLAESLYLLAAADRFGTANYRGAQRLEDEYWKKIGVSGREFIAGDGSGLSRKNAITARAFCELLRERRDVEWFVDSLPVSGRSGTLRYRLADRNVRAKTGTLDGVSGLSGYVRAASGKTIVFSVMANNYTGSASPIRQRIDAMVEVLAQQ